MKALCANKIIVLTFLLVFQLFAGYCIGAEERNEKNGVANIRREKAALVAQNITDDAANHPFWCGHDGLIYALAENGVYLHDVMTGRKDKVAGPNDLPLACTHDGQWLVYIDMDSLRSDDKALGNKVVDIWRYEFKTKRRQSFVVADYDEATSIGNGVLAPNGTVVFLGKQPKARINMPEPRWDIVWTQSKANLTAWFHDSTAIARVNYKEDNDRLLIEVLSPARETVVIEQKAKYILRVLTDGKNNVYMQASNEEFEPDLINEVVRCASDLKDKKLSCTPVLEDFSIKGFDVSSGGDTIVFTQWREGGCVRIAPTDDSEAPCVTEATYHPGFYLDVSPDDRQAAFISLRKKEDGAFANDLYLVRLKE